MQMNILSRKIGLALLDKISIMLQNSKQENT